MTNRPERRDESVQFSLKELMKLEDERIGEEKKARDEREAAEARTREETARREREALAAREREEADVRERQRREMVEEEARREAMSRAAVEQARIAVEARARAEESERERRHEIELVRVRAETQKKPGIGGFIGSGLAGAGVVLLAALLVHFGMVKPASARRIAELEQGVAVVESRADQLSHQNAKQADELAATKRELDAAKALLAASPPPASKTPATAPGGGKGPMVTPPVKPRLPDEKPCVDEHDPLCGTIRRH